ncbi:hypothetical protein BD779DRAFT_1670037 [Infundibulicybe gibba]|nr:hypothetical protein BD779DRAFT_1670037 [Infundibulicybe gibba]
MFSKLVSTLSLLMLVQYGLVSALPNAQNSPVILCESIAGPSPCPYGQKCCIFGPDVGECVVPGTIDPSLCINGIN